MIKKSIIILLFCIILTSQKTYAYFFDLSPGEIYHGLCLQTGEDFQEGQFTITVPSPFQYWRTSYATINAIFEKHLTERLRYSIGVSIEPLSILPIPFPGAGLSWELISEKGLIPGISFGIQGWSVGSISASVGIGKTLPFKIFFFLPSEIVGEGRDFVYASVDYGYASDGYQNGIVGRYLNIIIGYDFNILRHVNNIANLNLRICFGVVNEFDWPFFSFSWDG